MSQKLTKKQLFSKLNYHKGMMKRYDSLLRKQETSAETVSREVKSWPKWKRDIKIGTFGMTKKEREEKDKADRQYYEDGKRYSYWPGGD